MNSLGSLQPWLQPYAEWITNAAAPYGARVTSTRRSYTEQYRLYRRWINGQSNFPAAPPGHSMHERGRAFDVDAPGHVLNWMGYYWQLIGGTWGARGGDPIHFEA